MSKISTTFIKNGKPNINEIIMWLYDNSTEWRKSLAEKSILDLTEQQQLLLCIWYYAQQQESDHEL